MSFRRLFSQGARSQRSFDGAEGIVPPTLNRPNVNKQGFGVISGPSLGAQWDLIAGKIFNALSCSCQLEVSLFRSEASPQI
jgi:hypothetical protein